MKSRILQNYKSLNLKKFINQFIRFLHQWNHKPQPSSTNKNSLKPSTSTLTSSKKTKFTSSNKRSSSSPIASSNQKDSSKPNFCFLEAYKTFSDSLPNKISKPTVFLTIYLKFMKLTPKFGIWKKEVILVLFQKKYTNY